MWPFIIIMTHGRPWRVDHSIMTNVTWRRFNQSAKQLIAGHTTVQNSLMTSIQCMCVRVWCVYLTEPLTLPVPVTSPLGTLYNYTVLRTDRGFSYVNWWPTFSPYLYNTVWSELTCRNPLSHSRLACSRLSAHIQPSVNNPDTNGAANSVVVSIYNDHELS